VDSSLRASAFAGLGAFLLSIIIAVFSRVPFLVLLLRALVSGLGFFALFYGAQFVLKRFLPELFDESMAARSSPVTGTLVDIVIPGGDDSPHEGARLVVDEPMVSPHIESTGAPASPAPVLGVNEIEREVADLRSDQLLASDPGGASENGNIGLAPHPSVALDELDSLPDLDGLSDAFADSTTPVSGNGDVANQIGVSESMPTASGPSTKDGGQDPALLAKAVQTLLRRDQKGQ
jgi:hypothetical protein